MIVLRSALLYVKYKGGSPSTKFCEMKYRLHSGTFLAGTSVPSCPSLRPGYGTWCQESHMSSRKLCECWPRAQGYVWAIQGSHVQRAPADRLEGEEKEGRAGRWVDFHRKCNKGRSIFSASPTASKSRRTTSHQKPASFWWCLLAPPPCHAAHLTHSSPWVLSTWPL